MKSTLRRLLRVGLTLALVVLVGGVIWGKFLGGCQNNPKTRIAQKTTFQGEPSRFPGAAEDWPKWRGPRGDGISRETVVADRWPDGGPPQLWSAEVGLGYSSPIAANGRVYLFTLNNTGNAAGGIESLTAFDATTGQILWNDEGGPGWLASYSGTRATPAIDGDRIYTYGGTGELISRDVATGKQQWRVNVLKETGTANIDWGMSSSPLVAGDLIYVQAGEKGPVAVAVRKDSGQIAWQSEARGLGGYAHPLLADVSGTPQLIVFGGRAVYGMDPATGKTIWSHPWETDYGVNSTTPIYRDGFLLVSSAYGQGSLMLKLSPTGAERAWHKRDVHSKFPGMILDGSSVYANSEGTVKCIAWPDGNLRWSANDSKLRLGAGGSMVRAGDRLVMMSERGKLSLARATPEGIDLLSQADVFDGSQIWSTPLLYGGRLYAKGTNELVCFDVSGGASTRPTTGATAASE